MATDYFLKLEGVDGESTDDKHKGEIDLEQFSFGERQQGTGGSGGGGGAGKVAMNDFRFVSRTCKASPKLFLCCACGDHLKKAVLTCRKAGKDQQEYLVITMEDCLISSYDIGAAGGVDAVPGDSFTINFAKISWEYKEQKPDGSLGSPVKAGYDCAANKKL